MTVTEEDKKAGEAEIELPYSGGGLSATAQPVSSETKLDSATVALLESTDTFYIQQKLQWKEALTQGCWEQPNIYTIMDKEQDNKPIMFVQEESENWNRCCCAPGHSLFAKFYLMDDSGQKAGTPVMTMEREGCDCCFTGPCPKPCLCCFACKPECSDKASFYAGDIASSVPGETKGTREQTFLLGEAVQPITGGGFKPVLQIMDRGDDPSSPKMFAAARGPCFFGGCSELCCDSKFGISVANPESDLKEIHQLPFGDFASITKIRPKGLGQAARELFTDSDIYEVHFHNKSVTPQQKANILASMIHLDYMFFERDNDMCYCTPDGALHIVICNCFIYGCVCPCECVFKRNNGDGGGGGN